jgi:hypothetical protein
MEPLTYVLAGVLFTTIVALIGLASKVGNMQIVLDNRRLDTIDNQDAVDTAFEETHEKISDVLSVVSNAIDTIPTNVPSFDSLKALQDRIEVGYQFAIREVADKMIQQVAADVPTSTALILSSVLTSIAVNANSGVPLIEAIKGAAGNLQTTVAITKGGGVPIVSGVPDDAQLLEGVLRGDNDALRQFLATPYAQEVLRGILGGNDQVQ